MIKKFISIICIFLTFSTNVNASNLWAIIHHKDSPEKLDLFLEHCTDFERITLAQSLGYLPEIPKEAFGNLKYIKKKNGKEITVILESYDHYADSIEDAKRNKLPLRPKTYNEIPPELAYMAISKDLFSPEKIKKELTWAANHWASYPFKECNYPEIVEWVANERKISFEDFYEWREEKENELSKKRNYRDFSNISTSDITEIVARSYFKRMFNVAWNKMDEKERIDFLEKVETELKKIDKNNAIQINDIAGIASGSAATAFATLSTVTALSGFAFYTTMSSVICSTFAIIGVTLPFSVYMAVSSGIATLGGPIGWAIAGTMLIATPFFFGGATIDPVEKFIVTKYLIESSHKDNGDFEISHKDNESFEIFGIPIF